jgi:hypothetical protein
MVKKKIGAVSEQRLYKRYNVKKMKMTADLSSSDATIYNLSSGGACIIVSKHMNLGQECSLKLRYHDATISLTAIVRWSNMFKLMKNYRGEVVPTYITGVEFKKPFEHRGIDIAEVVGVEIEI